MARPGTPCAILLALFLAGCASPAEEGTGTSAASSSPATSSTGTSPSPTGAAPVDLPGHYIMAFHACDTAAKDCGDFRNHVTYVATSPEGAEWSLLEDFPAFEGSVPDAVRRGNTLYVYGPGSLTRYHLDTKTLDPPIRDLRIQKPDGSKDGFADPSPFLDEDGRIVLVYLRVYLAIPGGSPAGACRDGEAPCTIYFPVATEVEGSDGAQFMMDGIAVQLTANQNQAFTDPDVFQTKDGYVVLVSSGQSVRAYQSSTLKGTYEAVPGLTDALLVRNGGGVPAGHYDAATGKYWIYAHTSSQGSPSAIKRAVTDSLGAEIPASSFTTVLSGSTVAEFGASWMVESPGFSLDDA